MKSDDKTTGGPDSEITTETPQGKCPVEKKTCQTAKLFAVVGVLSVVVLLIAEICTHRTLTRMGKLLELESALKNDQHAEVLKPGIDSILEKARALDGSGDHATASLYWQNALEHADSSRLLTVLQGYAESVLQSAKGDFTRYSDAVALERMAAVAIVKVPSGDIPAAKELHDKCAAFRDSLLVLAEPDAEESPEVESTINPAEEMANAVDSILREMEETINAYAPGDGEKPTDAEYKILQLSGVTENAMSQLWLLDRSALSAEQRLRIDAFPGRLNGLLDKFNARHDTPILSLIGQLEHSNLPKTTHQANIDSLTNQIARIVDKTKILRGTPAQEAAQKTIVALQGKVANERRQQMNEYQQFVANCCKLAFDSFDDTMNTGSAGYGRLEKTKGYKDENDFISRYVRHFASNVPLSSLRGTSNRKTIYEHDSLLCDALRRSSGGPKYFDVANHHKAFIVTAIYGFYRIDQSLLLPETARLYNDVFQKYYEKMDAQWKAATVRWMVEEPKVRLEDF